MDFLAKYIWVRGQIFFPSEMIITQANYSTLEKKKIMEKIIMTMQQEDIEETARSELWREELIEEIEQKVGGLRELEEAGKK